MKIEKIATWVNRVNEEEALRLAEEKGLRFLNSKELQDITEDNKLWNEYEDYFPCRSGTKIKYKEGSTKAIIQHPGEKPKEIHFPLNDGYYEVGEDGIPNGKKSNILNAKARYLCRWQDRDFEGLVARYYDYFGVDRRGVYCGCGPSVRYGVLGTKGKVSKSRGKKTYEQGIEEGKHIERERIMESFKKILQRN